MWDDYDRPMHDGWTTGGWVLMVLVLVLLLALIAAVVFLALRTGPRPGPGQDTTQRRRNPNLHTAEQLLAERYASGELDYDEYRHRLELVRL